MSAPQEIRDLVERFEQQLEIYKSGSYNETQLRRDFLDPLFRTLGWDVDNTGGYAEAYRDVIHEDAIHIGGAVKAPDYCFRVGGTRKFFVEAKKPQVRIREEVPPAYQLRRYAWSAKLPLSILSDFEEFAVYDCRVKPAPTDAASTARVFYGTFREYAEKWDWIASVFSREAVLKGSFDKYAETNKAKRGTTEVDADFLASMEGWRNELARNLALRNPALSTRELNFAVQRILDRIVFLRICEDRGLEHHGRLLALVNGPRIYPRLGELFLQADTRYNSGLFHFKAEKGRNEPPDALTRGLEVDDKLLRDLLKGLYYPESPYEFSVLSADILGQVYEQFLGKVIRLTDGHRAVVEEKPEVRKAGGVYYTPTYIVDYIVRETVGTLLADKTPKEAAKLRVLDPACGSGSFLIGAYQHLLDWHLAWYGANEPEKWAKAKQPAIVPATTRAADKRGGAGNWRLTIAERKRILLNNIHGVDIDAAAVEVTKLSLLLKVLEGETEQTIQTTFGFHHERALPDLGENIKCGNSLVGSDFYRQPKLPEMGDDERLNLNVFDWDGPDGFPEIMKAGGFDAVIGNPPYVNAWELFQSMPQVREYINTSDSYKTADRHWDLYILFLERSLAIARKAGRISFIIPYSFAIQKYGISLRKLLLGSCQVESIADLRATRVFGKVPVITIIPVIINLPTTRAHAIRVFKTGKGATARDPGEITYSHDVNQRLLLDQHESMLRIDLSNEVERICSKIESRSITVGDICWVNYGAQMSSRIKGKFGKEFVLRDRRTTSTCQKTVSGKNLYRYSVLWDGKWVEWELSSEMYGPREQPFFENTKLMFRDITGTKRLEVSKDDSGLYCDHTILCAHRATDAAMWKSMSDESISRSALYTLDLLLGLLASSLVSSYYYWKLTGEGVRSGGGFHTYPKTVRQLPIFDLTSATKEDLLILRKIEKGSAQLLTLHKQLAAAKTPHETTALERQIAATDTEIDRLVYQLYGLAEDEIRIVEGQA